MTAAPKSILPMALLPCLLSLAAPASAAVSCLPTASPSSVAPGGTITLQGNCIDDTTGAAVPGGFENWQRDVGGGGQSVGQRSLPNGTLTVVVPATPGDQVYFLPNLDLGSGGLINLSTEAGFPQVIVTVTDPCAPPVGARASRALTHAGSLVAAAPGCVVTQSTLDQISTPLTTLQTSRMRSHLDQAQSRMRALRTSRSTPLLDVQGVPLPTSTNSDGGEARKQTFGVYVAGLGDYLRQNSAPNQSAFKAGTTSLSVGADNRLNDDWVMGGNIGLSRTQVDFAGSASEQRSTGTQATVYAAWNVTPTTYVSATLSYEVSRFDLTRDDGAQQLSFAKPRGRGVGFSLSAGRDFAVGAWSFGPFVRWDNVTTGIDAFDETGGTSAVAVGAQRVRSNTLNLGSQAQYSVPVSWGIVLPYVRIELTRRTDKTEQAPTATLLNGGTALLIPTAVDTHGSHGNVALGMAGVNQGGISWFADYETGVAQKGYSTRRMGVGVRFEL